MQAVLSILPVIALVALGHILRRTKLIADESWPGIEQLGYRILFPAILCVSIYRSELSPQSAGPYVGAMALAFIAVGGLALWLRGPLHLSNPRASSMFQASLRINSLLILAVAAQGLGQKSLSDVAVALAFLIPSFNIAAIVVLTLLPPEAQDRPATTRAQASRRILAEILRNPMVLGCSAGLALNLTGTVLPGWILAPLDWLGQGALAIGLLSVGAGIQIRRLLQSDLAMWSGVALRLLICPALFAAIGFLFSLPADQIASGLLATAAPGASVGYILARQMGGDADFFADIFTWQTVLSAVTLPMWLFLASNLVA